MAKLFRTLIQELFHLHTKVKPEVYVIIFNFWGRKNYIFKKIFQLGDDGFDSNLNGARVICNSLFGTTEVTSMRGG